MARIRELDSSQKPKGKAGKPGSPSAVPVILLVLITMGLGVYTHVKAIHQAPDGNGKVLLSSSCDQLRKYLNVPKSWPGTRFFDEHANGAMHYFLLLLVVFKQIGVDDTGKGLLFFITVCIMPSISLFSIEGMKDGSSALTGIAALIAVTSLGQLICVGAAMPLVMFPLYAYARWSELKTPDLVKPLPSPSNFRLHVITICNVLALGTILLTALTPVNSEYWVIANIIFQFFPIAFVPLLFFSNAKTAVSRSGSASARQEPRLGAASSYRLTSFACAALYYVSLYYGFKGFQSAYEKNGYWGNDGHHLLFYDTLGCLGFTYAIVLLDSFIEEAKIVKGASDRVHERRSFPADLIMGLPGVILFGPGWAMSTYLQRREIRAEKVRFGIKANAE